MRPLSRVPRRLLPLAALAAAVLVIPTASAGSAAAIKGVGAGKVGGGLIKFELSAHAEDDDTTPENGFGQVRIDSETLSLVIDVRCVNPAVVGDRPSARISGVVTRASAPVLVGQVIDVQVADGGEPSGAPVDTFEFSVTLPPAETNCLRQPPADLPPNVEDGNIVVKLGRQN